MVISVYDCALESGRSCGVGSIIRRTLKALVVNDLTSNIMQNEKDSWLREQPFPWYGAAALPYFHCRLCPICVSAWPLLPSPREAPLHYDMLLLVLCPTAREHGPQPARRGQGPLCDAGGDLCKNPACIPASPAHVLGSPSKSLRIVLLAQALGVPLAASLVPEPSSASTLLLSVLLSL